MIIAQGFPELKGYQFGGPGIKMLVCWIFTGEPLFRETTARVYGRLSKSWFVGCHSHTPL